MSDFDGRFEYRTEVDFSEAVDRIVEQVNRYIDEAALKQVEDRLEELGYFKVGTCDTCRWSRIHDGKSYPMDDAYKGAMYCLAWSDGYQGEWTKPYGFCHKWQAKEVG